MKERGKTSKTIEEMLVVLSDFKLGNFTELNSSEDEILNPLINKINEVSTFFKAQAQAQAQAKRESSGKGVFLENVLSSLPALVAYLDPSLKYLYVNEAYEKFLGYSEKELQSKSILDVTHPDDKTQTRDQIQKLPNEGGMLQRFEKRFIHKSGKIVWGRVTSQSLKDEAGNPNFLSMIEDITEVKEREIETNTIFETMADGLVLQDLNGTIEKFNPSALELLGLTEGQLRGRTSLDPLWKAVKEDGSAFPGEEHPAMLALKSGKPVKGTLMGLTLGDGTERWIKINAVPFESTTGLRVACTFSDVSNVVFSNSEMKHIFNHTIDLMCIAGIDGKFKKISPSFKKILGYEESELLSCQFADFIHPDDLAATSKIVEILSQGVSLINFENRYRLKKGGYRRISWVCEPDVKTGLLYATGRDITDLRILESRNAQILEAIDQSAIVAFTDASGKITEINDNFCKITGYSKEELIGKDHRIVNSGAHSKEFFKKMWATIQAGKTWTGDLENRRKNGEHYFVRTVLTPIKSTDGVIEQFMAIRFDVTEQKRSEKALMAALDFNDAILRNAKFSIVTGGLDGIITGFNEEAERMLGYSASEMIGKQSPAIFHDPNEVVEVAKILSKEFNAEVQVGFDTFVFKAKQGKGKFDEREWTYIRKDGERLPVLLNVTGLFDSKNQLNGFLGIAKDLSERHALLSELEQERVKSIRNSKLASLGEMSAGIAHEINNPLAIIEGNVDLLTKYLSNPEKLNSKIETIKASCKRIEKIVRGLKKFSRSDEKTIYATRSLFEILNESINLISTKSKRYDTPVIVECNSDLLILCNEIEIEQVLVNMINNSIDAVKNLKEKWVKVSAFADQESVVLRIMDSGAGIPESVGNKIFQPFFTTKIVGEGTGLGLSITKGILDEHKATIKIVSDLPNTCFEIKFPKAEQGAGGLLTVV